MQRVAELTISLRMRRQTVAVAAVAAPAAAAAAVVVNCQLAALLGFMQIAAALAMERDCLLPMTMTTAQRQL